MDYSAKDYALLLGTPGFSDNLLNTHFGLYQGYVANTNKVAGLLGEMLAGGRTTDPEYAELTRRFGWEFNGMRLHELYFDNLSKDGGKLEDQSSLASKLDQSFGSLDAWRTDFKAKGALRGIGWTILYYDKPADQLFNVWVNEHDVGHLSGVTPLLIMDVFEHAFVFDYGMKRADYIEAFMNAVDWKTVVGRFEA